MGHNIYVNVVQLIAPNMNINELLFNKAKNNEISNTELVQLIELAGMFLNLKTIPKYAKMNNLTYNGVKKTRQIVTIFDVKFVIDND